MDVPTQPDTGGPVGVADRVTVDLAERSYEVVIGVGLLDQAASFEGLPAADTAAIVTHPAIGDLYAGPLEAALRPHFQRVLRIDLPEGESHKSWESVNRIFDALLAASCDRQTVLFALGGGVIGDITGFASASYMRGTPFVQVPTTLLAQVDSSVGGKTGINHPLGKNMIGAFHQPGRVVADVGTLRTLPERELRSGLAEVIKYGFIADEEFLVWLEHSIERLLARDEAALAHAIKRSCEIKARVVAGDEREGGARAILNFGHTFGHAIEAGLGFGTWLHGEAVAAGMVMAAELSQRMRLVSDAHARRVEALVARAGLPTRGPALGVDRYRQSMLRDKKADRQRTRYVLLDGVGRAVLREAPDGVVAEVIEAFTAD